MVILEEEGNENGVRFSTALTKHDDAVAFVAEEDRKKKSIQPGCWGSFLAFWNGIRISLINLIDVA
jgi:hypothetical protein